MSKLRLIGAVGIKVRPDASGFRRELQEDLRRVPDEMEIDVKLDLDTAVAKRKIKDFEKEHDGKTIKLHVSTDYDSIQNARQQLKSALKGLDKQHLSVKLNEGDLNKAMDKLNRMRSSAKVSMEISQDEAGYRAVLAKIDRIRSEKAAVKVDFKTSDKDLDRMAREYRAKIKELEKPATITLTHRNDRDSLRRAVDQIDDALANLKQVQITPELNESALLAAKEKLKRKLDAQPFTMQVNEDKEGYEAALKRIQQLQRSAGATKIKFKTDEASLAREAAKIKAKLAKLTPKPKIEFKYTNDTFGLQKAIDEVNEKLREKRQVTITADLDEKGLLDAKKRLEESLAKSSFEVKVDKTNLDDLKREREKIEAMLSKKRVETLLSVKNDKESLEAARRELDKLVKKREAEIKAKPFTLDAALQLAYASRARDVPFYVRINQKSLAVAEGVLKSLAGINVLRESGEALENMVTKFDTFSLKVGAVSTLLASMGDAITFVSTALFPVAEGLANLVGLMAFAPTAMAAVTSVVLINIAAFNNFRKAIDGNAEAMAALPPQAQATAEALKGAWKKIEDPAQVAYWRGMGSAMKDALAVLLPQISKGLANASEHAGRFGAGVFNALKKSSLAGGPVEKMLGNLSLFFDHSVGAAEPLVNAITRLGLRGSEFLPRFGDWITDITTRFDAWLKKSDEAGRITVWMEQGIQSLKDIFTMSGGIIKMLQGINTAAKLAGAGSLHDVAEEFDRIGEFMKGDSFQGRLATIFDGARAGASHLNVGVKELGETFGKSSLYVSNMLSMLGELGGITLANLSKGFSGATFQQGTLQGVGGMIQMLETLQQGFRDLGSIIGNMSRIAGSAFTGIAPIINDVLNLLNIVVGNLTDGLVGQIPSMTALVGGFIATLTGPISLVSDLLGNVLEWAGSMGPTMQMAVSAVLGFLLVAGRVGPMFAAKPGGLMEKIIQDFKGAETAGQRFGIGIKGLGAGLLGALGGPWGIAIGVVTAGLAAWGASTQQTQADIESMTATLDENTGAITKNTNAMITKNIIAQRNDGFYLFSSGAKSASETLQALGKSVEDTAAIVAKGGQPYDDMIALLNEGKDALAANGAQFDQNGLMVQGSGTKLEEWAKKMGIAKDAVTEMDLIGLIDTLQKEANKRAEANRQWDLAHDSIDQTTQRTRDFNAAMQTFNDTTQNADSRVRGLKAALDVLQGKQPSVEEAQLKVNDAMRQAAGHMQTVNGQAVLVGGAFRDLNGNLLNFNGVIDTATGKIDTTSEAGAGLYRNLQSVTDGVLQTVTGMKDSGAGAQELGKFLADSRQKYIDMAVAAGMNAETVAKAYDRMIGANPKELLTTITAQGVEDAELKLKNYKGTLEEIDAYRAVAKIAGDDTVLGVKLADSYTKLSDFDKVIATATANLDPKQADAVRLRIINDLVNLANTNPTVRAKMDPALLDIALRDANADLDALSRKRPTPIVNAQVAEARSRIQMIIDMMAGLQSKDIQIGVNTVYTETGPKPQGWVAKNGQPTFQANGSLSTAKGYDPRFMPSFSAFANGGIAVENPSFAKIYAPATNFRIFAEPSTGGEAFIPMAASKRPRSTAILSEVARQFGYDLTKADRFADGGVVGAGSRSRSGHSVAVNIDSYIQQSNDTADDIARALMRRVKVHSGAPSPLGDF